jgi:hypothetical protein
MNEGMDECGEEGALSAGSMGETRKERKSKLRVG